MSETHLYYPVTYGYTGGGEKLESIIEISTRLKTAQERTGASSDDVEVSVGLIGQEYGSCYYGVKLTAPDKVRLQDALKVFLSEGGLPDVIYGEERLAEELLTPYGKRLRKDFTRAVFGGKRVVDAE